MSPEGGWRRTLGINAKVEQELLSLWKKVQPGHSSLLCSDGDSDDEASTSKTLTKFSIPACDGQEVMMLATMMHAFVVSTPT